MPLYEYKCPEGHKFESEIRADKIYCTEHVVGAQRVWSWRMPKEISNFQPHFNLALGKWVNSKREFEDGLKLASQAASISTGVEHNYQTIYPSDIDQVGISSEAVEECKEHDAKVGQLERLKAGDNEYLR